MGASANHSSRSIKHLYKNDTQATAMKKLSFKGDVSKKRKRVVRDTNQIVPKVSTHVDEDEDGWLDADCLADMSGPIMVAYNYDGPVSLIADARGTVFTIPLDPMPKSLDQAEPHDTRQVFVAANIVSRPSGTISLKNGASGKYLTTDRFGQVKCDKDAIGTAEEWIIVKRPDGWSLQSVFERYLSISSKTNEVRCDVEDIGFCETFRVRIQARTRSKRLKDNKAASTKEQAVSLMSKTQLETKCGRTLATDEVEYLHAAQRDGSIASALLDVRVKGRADKFG